MRRPNYVVSSLEFLAVKRLITRTGAALARMTKTTHTPPCPLLDELQQYKAKLCDYLLFPDPENFRRVCVMHKRGNAIIAEVREQEHRRVYTVASDFIDRDRIDTHTNSHRTMSTKSLPKLVSFIKTLPIADDRDIAYMALINKRDAEHVRRQINGETPFTFYPRYSESRGFVEKMSGVLAGVVEKVDAGIPVSALDTETIKEALNEVGYYRSKNEYERRRERDTRLDGKTQVLMFEPPRLKGTGTIAFYTQPTGIVYVNSATEPDKVPQEIQALYATLTINGDTDTVGVVDNWGSASHPDPSTPPSIALMLVSEDTVNALFGREKTGEHNDADA